MGNNGKTTMLTTIKKDEAAFYLSELARGLLKDRVNLRLGEGGCILATFASIHMEMKASEKDAECAVDIHLSGRKPAASMAGAANGHGVQGKTDTAL